MWKGCLLAIGLLVGAYFAEVHFLGPLQLPFAEALAPALALGVTLSLMTLYGLPQSLRSWKTSVGDQSQWRDGEVIQVVGRLQAEGKPLKAPVSGRDALLYEYRALRKQDQAAGREGPVECKLMGVDSCPCRLSTQNGSLRVSGFAPLQSFETTSYGGEAYLPQAARFILSRKWRPRPKLSWDLLKNPAKMVGNSEGEWEGDVATPEAEEKLLRGLADQGSRGEEQLLHRLRGGNWIFEEQIVPPFAHVKLRGTYRQATQSLDINLSFQDAISSIEPAQADEKVASPLVSTLLFLVFKVGTTVLLHYVVYAENGKLYRELLRALGL